jgi:hypothetical protein
MLGDAELEMDLQDWTLALDSWMYWELIELVLAGKSGKKAWWFGH